MTNYIIYKTTHFRSECGGEYVNNEVKYYFEDSHSPFLQHPYTDTNPQRLFDQISKLYKKGDSIKSLQESFIEDNALGGVDLTGPLSSDEMRILAIKVLDALGKKEVK